MTRREIDAKFDEIVAFSEISRFIDTPIKRYSSGMQMRLAFAVAASLEPEILLIDEVLAVGDANFQRKCLGTVEEAGSSGRTIIFVSHNMAAVLRLCRRVILLENGRITADGDAATVVRSYLESGSGRMAERVWDDPSRAPGDAVARLRAVRVRNSVGEIAETINIREPLSIEVEYERRDPAGRPSANLHFFNDEGLCLFIANDSTNPESGLLSGTGIVRSVCHVPGDFLAEGTIYVHAALSTYNPLTMHALERDAVAFHVVEDLQLGAARGEYVNELPGVVRPALPWSLEFDSAHLSLPAATSTS
jgi:lipopolysaccharide transport system ATP-binding protein